MASARKKASQMQNDDGDEYWHSSNFKRFNFNEDEDEEDSIDIIRWDGSTATPIKPKQPAASQNQPAASTPRSIASVNTSSTSARYHSARKSQFPPSPANLPSSNDKPVHRPKTDQRSISEVVAAQSGGARVTDQVKLEAEVSSLRRQLHQAKRDSAAAPSKSDTLSRLMVGGNYVLELYKSKEDKAALLDDAMSRYDGNAILAVTLFMRDTLKRDIFSKELMSRPVAVDHYCAYLRVADEIDELHETLSALGRTEEAAMLKYRQCLSTSAASSAEIRISRLKDCIKYYFDSDLRLANETNAIFEHISMIERQSVVEDADSSAEKSGQAPVFKSHPRKESIINKSVISTLYYCCYYHWGESENLLSSPAAIRNQHRISERQFLFIAIAALCRMRRWRDLESLLTKDKSLFRSARLYSPIGFEKVVDILSKNLAPSDAVAKYCAEIENTDKRLEMAIKNNCHKVAIDCFVSMKDKQRMMAYLNQIPPSNDHMRQYLMKQSRSQDIKWKN